MVLAMVTFTECQQLLVCLGIHHPADEGHPPVQPVEDGQLVQDASQHPGQEYNQTSSCKAPATATVGLKDVPKCLGSLKPNYEDQS